MTVDLHYVLAGADKHISAAIKHLRAADQLATAATQAKLSGRDDVKEAEAIHRANAEIFRELALRDAVAAARLLAPLAQRELDR